MKIEKINDAFTCAHCGKQNPPHPTSCRNHCRSCLFSLHVDDKLPGDRASSCKEKMYPAEVQWNGKKGYVITHECTVCGHQQHNKAAPDDSVDALIRLMNSSLLP